MNWLLIAALVERGSFLPSNWLSGPAWQAPGVLGEAGWPWGWREASAQALPWEAVRRGELAPGLGPQGSHFPGKQRISPPRRRPWVFPGGRAGLQERKQAWKGEKTAPRVTGLGCGQSGDCDPG